LSELEGFGFDRETVLAALAAGKRNSITATYRLALHQRYLRERDSASASGMFASVRRSRDADAAAAGGGGGGGGGGGSSDSGWVEDEMGMHSSGPLSLQDVP
jgi:hypothetical protein